MAKNDKKYKDDLFVALGNLQEEFHELREETREHTLGVSKSIEQLKGAGSDSAAIANSFQAVRQEFRQAVNALSQQIEQAQLEQSQSMLVGPEADTSDLTKAVSSLREEVQQNALGVSESISQLKASGARQADTEAMAASIEALRMELHDGTARLSQRIEQVQLEQTERESVAHVVDTSEFSNSVHNLRDELKGDLKNLAQAIARNEPPPKGSPVLTAVGVLALVAAGASGMAFYQSWFEGDSQPQALSQLDAKLVALNTKVDTLGQQDLQQLLEESRTKDATREQEAANQLNATIVGLQNSLSGQDKQIEQGFTNLTDTLANEVAKIVAKEVITVAKPPVGPAAGSDSPKESDTADAGEAQGGAADAADDDTAQVGGDGQQVGGDGQQVGGDGQAAADNTAAVDPQDATLEKVDQNVVRSPVQAKLIIDNPTDFDFELKINGEEVKVAARGVTALPVTQGVVKTEIGRYAKEWDDWEVVDGVPRLTIKVESGGTYFKLLGG